MRGENLLIELLLITKAGSVEACPTKNLAHGSRNAHRYLEAWTNKEELRIPAEALR
jgi:hypothetical protein